MKTLLATIILACCQSVHAGAFAELAFTARQPYGSPGNTYVDVNGQKVQEQVFRLYDINYTRNPYCSVMVGYQWKLKTNFELGLALHHESSIATGYDRGINDLRVSLRWAQ